MNEVQQFLFGYDADLPLEVRLEAELDEAPFEGQRFSYLSAGPVRVPALLARALDGSGASVLIQHGGGESKDDPLIRLLLRRWSEAGLTCLAIDAPNHGERSPVRVSAPRRGFFEYVRTRVQNVIDLRRAIDYLVSEEGVDPARVGYWGVSMGGGVGVMLMAADSRVRAACLCLAGARSRRSWPAVDAGVASYVAENLDPAGLAALLDGREVLMLNGNADQTVPRDDALRLFEAMRAEKEQRWFAGGHKVSAAMLRASKEFFDRTLG